MGVKADLYILVVGNVIDGLRFVGPFESPDEAGEYAEVHERHSEWSIGDLEEDEPLDIENYVGCGDVCCEEGNVKVGKMSEVSVEDTYGTPFTIDDDDSEWYAIGER